MALMHTVVACFPEIAKFLGNSQVPLLLLGCPFWNSCFPIIFAYFEKTDIIVDPIDAIRKGMFFVSGVILKIANCCLDIMSECLAILYKLTELSFSIGDLYFDREGKLLKQRRLIMYQCFVMVS
jgi:hypothetical protein